MSQPQWGQGSVLASTNGGRQRPGQVGVGNFDSREGFQDEAEETGSQQAVRKEH